MFASCDRKEEPSIDSHVVGFMSCSLHVASQALLLCGSQCANASAVVDLLFFGGCCASAGIVILFKFVWQSCNGLCVFPFKPMASAPIVLSTTALHSSSV